MEITIGASINIEKPREENCSPRGYIINIRFIKFCKEQHYSTIKLSLTVLQT